MILRQLGPKGVWPGENTGDMRTVNKYLIRCHVEQEAGLLCLASAGRSRTNIWELHGGRCGLQIRKNFLIIKVV